MNRWEQLSNYLIDGMLEIDNTSIENMMRPVALGRKNYLFAGSHEAAQRAAMIYSFFAMCKKEEVNPQAWLKHVFDHIMDTNLTEIGNLLPANYKKSLLKYNLNIQDCTWTGGYEELAEGKIEKTKATNQIFL